MKRVYIASPLGFATSTEAFMHELVTALQGLVEIENPWDDTRFESDFVEIATLDSHFERVERLQQINREIGASNVERIDRSDAVFAVLDGVDVDSGTASEIGYAFAQGKQVFGLRSDFRLAGDNLGATVNLQVEYFIRASNGRILNDVKGLVGCAMEIL